MVMNSGNSVDIIKPLDELCLGAEFICKKKEKKHHTYPHTSQKIKNNRLKASVIVQTEDGV